MKFDLLIVGEGLASLVMLLHLPASLKIGVISRNKRPEEISSYLAQGGISAVFSAEDNFEKHVQDTLVAGDGLCNEEAVRKIIGEGTNVLNWLIELGVPFTCTPGSNEIHLTHEGGHSERRVAHVEDMTGRGIMQTLQSKVAQLPNVVWIRQHEVLEIISDGSTIGGVITENLDDKKVAVFHASNVVLAAGGLTGLYQYATNSHASKGEAIAIAWRAGARVENLEFVQFHPTAFQFENQVISLISEAVRGEGGHLYNIKGERFMPKYSSQEELAPRDIVSRAIYSEMQIHNATNVWLDITHQGEKFVTEHFPNLVELTGTYGSNLATRKVPVSPAAHYTCGGVASDVAGRTNIEGLYVIGEIANCGLHGANRLASNSLLECVVMGKLCAETVREKIYLFSKNSIKIPAFIKTRFQGNLLSELRSILWSHAGIVRSNDGIKLGLKKLSSLRNGKSSLLSYAESLRSRNIYDAAYLLLHSAALRKESRGGHFNINYQTKWKKSRSTIIEGKLALYSQNKANDETIDRKYMA